SVCHGQFVLNGSAAKSKLSKVYLFYNDDKGVYRTDSAAVRDGKFRFSGSLKEPLIATLSNGMELYRSANVRYGTIVLEPKNMSVAITSDNFEDMKVTGSALQEEYNFVDKPVKAIRNRWKNIFDTLTAVNKRSNVEFQELKNWVLVPYETEVEEVYAAFFKKYPASIITAYFLRAKTSELSEDSLRKMYNRLTPQAKQSANGKAVLVDLENKKKGVPGAMAADFAATDINGKPLKLSGFRGKYVLLDFWASWCVPCRKGNPHLINLYNQYKDKGFEIIGISDDDRKEEAWHKAVEQDKIGIWKHVLRGLDMEKRMKNLPNPNDISEKYNISSLPTKILIDKNGMVIGRYGSDAPELDQKLAEIMPGGTANVKGFIRNLKDSVTFVWNEEKGSQFEKVPVVNERFSWQKSFASPQKIMLSTPQRYMQFFIENGNINIDGSADSLYFSNVTGSRSQEEFKKYEASIEPLKNEQYKLYPVLRKTEDRIRKGALEKSIDSISLVIDEQRKNYITGHSSSPVSLSIVEDMAVVGDYTKVAPFYQLLSPEARRTDVGQRLWTRLEVLKRRAPGALVKDFAIPSLNGQSVRISDFKGKYLFIDFWASWCGPCRAENPNVLRAYNDFKEKNFTVLGISVDEQGDKWKEAVEKDKMPWTQVSDLKGMASEVAKYYGILAIPSTMLLDPEGRIITTNLRGEKLHEELRKILK
ncbi:redoxin domain-containing protein, partial [Chitinophaga sp.]|uniref:redoxin domain-containing protein n=1 Tax=Chitinophaga sp. TaxID=1869181 RepID=UPI002BD0DDB4